MTQIPFNVGVIKPVECFKQAWELIKNDYWILFLILLVGIMIGAASLYIVLGAMMCGIFYAYIKKIDGKPIAFEDLFKGFSYFLPSLLILIVVIVPSFVMMGIVYAPFIALALSGAKPSSEELMGILAGSLIVDLIVSILLICFHTLLFFSFPLVVDRNLSAFDAMKTSAKAVWQNLGGVVGLILIGAGINMVGALACGIGVYFTIPIVFAGNVLAYRKVFPAQTNLQPPPPDAYSNAGSYT
ncbi:hypothetical protein BH10ACI1_BH10ACI1_25810 [soil metagenome]